MNKNLIERYVVRMDCFFFEKPLRTKDWVSALLIKQTRNELNKRKRGLDLIASQIKAKKVKRGREVGDYHERNKIRANAQERKKSVLCRGNVGLDLGGGGRTCVESGGESRRWGLEKVRQPESRVLGMWEWDGSRGNLRQGTRGELVI